MSILAQRLSAIRPSETKAMTARAAELARQGRDIIALTLGEPDFPTPQPIRAAAVQALEAGHTRYTPVAGIPELREAIAAKLARDNALTYDPNEITVGCGAKQVIFNALLATLDPGDEVIFPTPCWVSYPDMVRLAGGVPVPVACDAKSRFKLGAAALEAAITPRTKWLMLNSPCNPTGAVYSRSELESLASVLRAHPGVWVICDDIYEPLVYDGAEFATLAAVAPDLKARVLTVNGVSKSYAMTGWRVGYGAGPSVLIKAMNTIQGQTTSHTSSISQYAAVAALNGDQSCIRTFRERFQGRRDLVLDHLSRIDGLECLHPEGAFYLFISCASLIGSHTRSGATLATDTDFAMYLLEEAGVGVVPGSAFLAAPYIRISYAASEADLVKACERIAGACQALRRDAVSRVACQ